LIGTISIQYTSLNSTELYSIHKSFQAVMLQIWTQHWTRVQKRAIILLLRDAFCQTHFCMSK